MKTYLKLGNIKKLAVEKMMMIAIKGFANNDDKEYLKKFGINYKFIKFDESKIKEILGIKECSDDVYYSELRNLMHDFESVSLTRHGTYRNKIAKKSYESSILFINYFTVSDNRNVYVMGNFTIDWKFVNDNINALMSDDGYYTESI